MSSRILKSLKYRANKLAGNTRQRCKVLYQRLRRIGPPKCTILIMGCQRSGTTLLERIFRHDFDSVVYGEFSELSIAPDRSVWQPLADVRRITASQNARYIVARPLFESDRAQEILAALDDSYAIWLYRDFRQVVRSMINKWQDRFFDISRENESDGAGHWRLKSLHQQILDELPAGSSIEDQYALYWHARNSSFFDQNLENEFRVKLVAYDQLVNTPRESIDEIMKFAGRKGIWRGFKTDAHQQSLSVDDALTFTPEVEDKCNQLMVQLSEIGQSRNTE